VERCDDLHADLILERIHAATFLKVTFGRSTSTSIPIPAPGGVDFSIDDIATLFGLRHSTPRRLASSGSAADGIGVDRLLYCRTARRRRRLSRATGCTARGPVRADRSIDDRLDQHHRLRILPLLMERGGEAELSDSPWSGETASAGAELLLGFLRGRPRLSSVLAR